MTPASGRGVQVLLSWLNTSVERERARQLVDGLDDVELADVLTAIAAAELAAGGRGAVLIESAAARLRGVDVERRGSDLSEDLELAPVQEHGPYTSCSCTLCVGDRAELEAGAAR